MQTAERTKQVEINPVEIAGETFYKISNSNAIRPFFMSIVSSSNHWMFVASNGGISAGRKNAEHALFPYYTDDKITESAEITGSKSIFRVHKNGSSHLWEPFSIRQEGKYDISRNLYKNVLGNKVIFEEINHDLGLSFSYHWNSSDRYGFIKRSIVKNNSHENVSIEFIDGIQNIIPHGVASAQQQAVSNLVDAYKRSELQRETGMGIYALSAVIVDKAEPSEALTANLVWSIGLENATYLLSSLQLDAFRKGLAVLQEHDIKAEKGAYFIHSEIDLPSKNAKEWMIVANVNQTQSSVAELAKSITENKDIEALVNEDIALGSTRLLELNAAADGLQLTADHYRDTRHLSNVLFNIMRGGIFDHNYQIEKHDFFEYLNNANHIAFNNAQRLFQYLPETFNITQLKEVAQRSNNADLQRLCLEYMPLKFSRRHGDPSRPWNVFTINTRSEIDGSKILDYEGNWRDIFQNWEALAHSYPEFVESMIHKFLNATTFDGYNPYRVTKDGFDWETIEADDPWSYIGYWGDHQIIYLLKFLEFIEHHKPGVLARYFDKDLFVFANVPYKIKPYAAILKNPKDTIDFDHKSDDAIRKQVAQLGADGALLRNENGDIHHVNFIEKILATVLAKLSNFIPEGGIWMNTQRPEWNDANNALVGNGVSMVTLYYLRRFFRFLEKLLATSNMKGVRVSSELVDFYRRVRQTFRDHKDLLSDSFSDTDRKTILDELGEAASEYRKHIYKRSFWGNKRTVSFGGLQEFVSLGLQFMEHSISANKREDNLYHAYNLMTIEHNDAVSISYLSEMLEGQVAALSSGYLSAEEALALLDGMKQSALFREDQYSYLLYPNKDLPGFLEKNNIPENSVKSSVLLSTLLEDDHREIVVKDVNGKYHFNGNFRNAKDLEEVLNDLADGRYSSLVEQEKQKVLQIFEDVFNHKAFTGRSGTFFGYEGLGSIYWHMVSKLQLAVQEVCLKAIKENAGQEIIGRLLEHYYEINEGIGVHKSPELYGAFPTDPYSHTPAGKGAQQPGMTGQVKEDIISRFGELGVFVSEGKLYFDPCMLRKNEFFTEPKTFHYIDVQLQHKEIQLEENTLCFTYCQVPIIYKLADEDHLEIVTKDGETKSFDALSLDLETSKEIFERSGDVSRIHVYLKQNILK